MEENREEGKEGLGAYGTNWEMVFNKRETVPVRVPNKTAKDGTITSWKTVRVPATLIKNIENAADAVATNKLEAKTLELAEQHQMERDIAEGRTYSRKPVITHPTEESSTQIHERFKAFAMGVFRAAGYTVVPLLNKSAFDFVAYRGKGEECQTYYVLTKCGKLDVVRPLSPRQWKRVEGQYFNPRFGTANVTKLYWYMCTEDDTNRTFALGSCKGSFGIGMKPIPHPIPEFADYMAPSNEFGYECTVRRKKG